MNEADYWKTLEFRVCREFAQMPENHLRYLWCDGFVPVQYLLEAPSPRIMGRAWMGNGPKQEEWGFSLVLGHSVRARTEVDWPALLPPEIVSGWLTADPIGKLLQIEPSAAIAEGA